MKELKKCENCGIEFNARLSKKVKRRKTTSKRISR